jgi:hypothetical protein
MNATFDSHYDEKKALLEKLLHTKGNEKEIKKAYEDYFHYLSTKWNNKRDTQ